MHGSLQCENRIAASARTVYVRCGLFGSTKEMLHLRSALDTTRLHRANFVENSYLIEGAIADSILLEHGGFGDDWTEARGTGSPVF